MIEKIGDRSELEANLLSAENLLDALTQQVAVLDEDGRIVAVNAAWRLFGMENAGNDARSCVGVNYLDVCDGASGPRSREGAAVARAIREIAAGRQREFHLEYPCHSTDNERWFRMHASRLTCGDKRCIAVMHDDISERRAVENALGERVKELNCLYRITNLVTDPGLSQDEVLQAAVESIPGSWRHPDLTAARIVVHGRTFQTANFVESPWMQNAEMVAAGVPNGRLEVCYLGETPAGDQAPFLKEESALIVAIAEHLGRFVEREQAEENLRLNEARLNSLLGLFQKSSELDENEIIQFALEEAVKLTVSAIGYCHLVHEDQAAIELVTWSRDTLKQCEAVHETHYPIADAGVWADCARIQAPVVHNDYPSFSDRKGLPEGHAPLIRHLSVPVVEKDKVRVIMGVGNKSDDYDESDVRQMQLIANDAWQVVRRKRVESQLRIMATTDGLTGLANRRHLFHRGAEEVERIRRYGGALSLLMLDIDTFKSINDSYGHDVGDAVLREFAGCVRGALRDVDIVGRVGGEEFAVLLPSTTLEKAKGLAERLVADVRGMSFESSGNTFGVTVSIGVAAATDDVNSFDALLKAADIALYGAKDAGRDRVFV